MGIALFRPQLFRPQLVKYARQFCLGLGMALTGAAIAVAVPVKAAEQITFAFGPVERSLQLSELEQWAYEGVVSEDLAFYLSFLPADYSADELRQTLVRRMEEDIDTVEVDVVLLDRFFYTPQGEYLLEIASDFIRTDGRRRDLHALRGALLVAAADEDNGLSILNAIRQFPTPSIRIELDRALVLLREFNRVIYETEATIDLIEQLGATSPDLSAQEEGRLRIIAARAGRPGRYQVVREFLPGAPIPTDLYIPTLGNRQQTGRPAVIISHGLGNDRTSYAYLARHLASHGFVVLAVEHPGSNAAQIRALLVGQSADVVPNQEFTDRPRQISAVLDYLAQSPANSQRRLVDFDRIGLIGQSFGGYTAFTLAGAPLNFEQLRSACPPDSLSLNVSLLLQCQAGQLVDLEQTTLSLRDERIKAAIAVNPLTSVIFGEASLAQLETPIMIVASGADTVTPALQEQLAPFSWLTSPEKYLLVMRQGTHFSTIATTENGREVFELPETIIGPEPELAKTYLKAASLGFMTRQLTDSPSYDDLLTANGIGQLSREPITLSLIQDLTGQNLVERRPSPQPLSPDEAVNDSPDMETDSSQPPATPTAEPE